MARIIVGVCALLVIGAVVVFGPVLFRVWTGNVGTVMKVQCIVMTVPEPGAAEVIERFERESARGTECLAMPARRLRINGDGYNVLVEFEAGPSLMARLGTESSDRDRFELSGPSLRARRRTDGLSGDWLSHLFAVPRADGVALRFAVRDRVTGRLQQHEYAVAESPCACTQVDSF